MIVKHSFHSDANVKQYINSCLHQGKSISQHMLQMPHIGDLSNVFAYLPSSIEKERILDFQVGFIEDRGEARLQAVKHMSVFLKQSQDNYVVFEHPYAEPDDDFLKNSTQNHFIYRSEVYGFLHAQDNEEDQIVQLLSWSDGYPLIGWLVNLANDHLNNGATIDDSVLENIVSNVVCLILGIYDNELLLFSDVKI